MLVVVVLMFSSTTQAKTEQVVVGYSVTVNSNEPRIGAVSSAASFAISMLTTRVGYFLFRCPESQLTHTTLKVENGWGLLTVFGYLTAMGAKG